MNFFIGKSIGDPRYKKAAISGNYNAEMAAALFKTGNLLKLWFCGLSRLGGRLRGVDLIGDTQAAALGTGDENSGEKAQERNNDR